MREGHGKGQGCTHDLASPSYKIIELVALRSRPEPARFSQAYARNHQAQSAALRSVSCRTGELYPMKIIRPQASDLFCT